MTLDIGLGSFMFMVLPLLLHCGGSIHASLWNVQSILYSAKLPPKSFVYCITVTKATAAFLIFVAYEYMKVHVE